ncbi:MAG: hypothetical protein J7M38_07330 [Armatimonadetes bacterium]|nr:hypothetical protein [Armatimonadota bacterium]
MWRTRALTILAAALLFGATASAQPTYLLRYKWQEGENITWLVDVEASGEVLTRDLSVNPPGVTRMDVSMTMSMPQYQIVESVDDDGNGTVVTRMGTMEMDITMPPVGTQHIMVEPGGKATIAGADIPIPESLKQITGKPFKQVMSPRGDVLDMELPFKLEDFVDLGSTAPLQAIKALQQQPVIFPEQEAAEGYCWVNRQDLTPEADPGTELPPITKTMIYTLAGFEDINGIECARIELLGVMDIDGTLTMPMQGEGREGTSIVGPAHFSTTGTIWFDLEAGLPQKFEGSVLISVLQESEGSITVQDRKHDFHIQVEMNNFAVDFTMERAEEG